MDRESVSVLRIATKEGAGLTTRTTRIEAGKHVFMEKPYCVDPGDNRSLMETNKLVDQKNVKVGVGLFRRQMPTFIDAMKKLHAGEGGKIQFLRCYCNMTVQSVSANERLLGPNHRAHPHG